jgi:Zn-dependent protease
VNVYGQQLDIKGRRLSLCRDHVLTREADGSFIVSARTALSVRLPGSATAARLLALLERGIVWRDLIEALALSPQSRGADNLVDVLNTLDRAGLLDPGRLRGGVFQFCVPLDRFAAMLRLSKPRPLIVLRLLFAAVLIEGAWCVFHLQLRLIATGAMLDSVLSLAVMAAIVCLGIIPLHELSHASAAMLLGARHVAIVIDVSRRGLRIRCMAQDVDQNTLQQAVVALAGPLSDIFVYVTCAALLPYLGDVLARVANVAAVMALLLAVLNLIPVGSSDGATVIKALLKRGLGSRASIAMLVTYGTLATFATTSFGILYILCGGLTTQASRGALAAIGLYALFVYQRKRVRRAQ